jgi:hypothetical protein
VVSRLSVDEIARVKKTAEKLAVFLPACDQWRNQLRSLRRCSSMASLIALRKLRLGISSKFASGRFVTGEFTCGSADTVCYHLQASEVPGCYQKYLIAV